MNKLCLIGLILSTAGLVRPSAANIVETFDNGSDNGDWHLSSNPQQTLAIQPSGGNPGPYIRGDVATAAPAWYVPAGTTTDFLGDYYAKGVTAMSADINIFVGNNEPKRTMTLDLRSTFGTNDVTNEVEAYYIGPDISGNSPGWVSYAFPLDARSQLVPAGWNVSRAGLPGTFLDWQNLMHDVETLGFVLGQPGFAYTNHTVWDLGLDNPSLATAAVPEPNTTVDLAAGFLAVAVPLWRRSRKTQG